MQNHGGPRFGTSGKTCVSKSDKDVKRKVTWQRQLSTGETSAWGQPFFHSTVLGQQADHVQANLDEVVWRGLKVELCSHIFFWVKMNFGHFPGNVISTKQSNRADTRLLRKKANTDSFTTSDCLRISLGRGSGQNSHPKIFTFCVYQK